MAALVVTPYYGRPQQDDLFEWYATLAGEFPDPPIIVYSVPIRAAVDLAPTTARRPLAPLSEPSQEKVMALLSKSAHLSVAR